MLKNTKAYFEADENANLIVEHSFGKLKNRFTGIKEIAVKKILTAVNLIDCAIILHNYLELLGNIWNEDDDNFI
ncbi:11912_t:CDS:2, partial [Rhizophagus irregularis]